MTQPAELLRDYLCGLGRAVGARSVSLFVPAPAGSASPILIHAGDEPAVPELAGLSVAEAHWNHLEALLNHSPEAFTAQAIRLRSARSDGLLIRVPSHWPLSVLEPQTTPEGRALRRRSDLGASQPGAAPGFAIVGLRLALEHPLLAQVSDSIPVTLPLASIEDDPALQTWLLALIAAVASQIQQVAAGINDPVSGLPDRTGLLTALDRAIGEARESGRPMTLLLINPDDFVAVNERFGRDSGDEVMRDVAHRIISSHRISDRVAKYGGAIFASILTDASPSVGQSVAEKCLHELSESAFLNGAARLSFSVGVASFEPPDPGVEGALDLIRRADQALYAAKRAGGGQAVAWREEWRTEQIGNLDRLSGIFTGKITKDYRNMALLLDTVGVIAASSDFQGLAHQVVERLYVSLKPDRVGLFGWSGGERRLLRGLARRVEGPPTAPLAEGLQLDAEGQELVDRALRQCEPVKHVGPTPGHNDDPTARLLRCAVPLAAGETCLGCLYIDGRTDTMAMDATDLFFLKALASQLAVAADRAQLAEQETRRREQERQRLESELEDLRRALQEAKLVYRSPEMEALLAVARRVAPTEATVLIMGESGTGKELLARTIHQVSPRHNRRMVIVDCGAIPTSLIESELFGHEKGAFTGAGERKTGRLAEADGGTVLLDEIGELPVEVQSRLLRFVQEKQLTPVGGSRSRAVDVRLIASTNRDLAAEVAAGRFREDLYHRLNVVRLVIPPLRQRSEDILHLAEHFREIYGLLYRKSLLRFSPEAEALLAQSPWPGNVRELQNRVMQAVILCEGPELGAAELGLGPSGEPGAADAAVETALGPSALVRAAADGGLTPDDHEYRPTSEQARAAGPQPGTARPAGDEPLHALRSALAAQIAATLAGNGPRALPLGKWLSEDLTLEAAAASGGVARRAAIRLGMAEATFRRRLQKAQELSDAGLAARPAAWRPVRDTLADLVRAPFLDGESLFARARRVLLEEIVARVGEDPRVGSALLGVTPLTYQRWTHRLKGDASLVT